MYLCIIINEHLNYENTAATLTRAASRAIGWIIFKFKSLKNVGFETFSKLYDFSPNMCQPRIQ